MIYFGTERGGEQRLNRPAVRVESVDHSRFHCWGLGQPQLTHAADFQPPLSIEEWLAKAILQVTTLVEACCHHTGPVKSSPYFVFTGLCIPSLEEANVFSTHPCNAHRLRVPAFDGGPTWRGARAACSLLGVRFRSISGSSSSQYNFSLLTVKTGKSWIFEVQLLPTH